MTMPHTAYICQTCGVQYAPSAVPPPACPVCEDERQYVPPGGQTWTQLQALAAHHHNVIEKVREQLYAIYTVPAFAIGQRAHLLQTPGGNILWDCISLVDPSTQALVEALGGLRAICISHPHYFASLQAWSAAFGDVPVYVHSLDAAWLGWKPDSVRLWEGEVLSLWDGISLRCCGGHFPGGNILHWPAGRALLTGDIIQVCPDRRSVSFMYSYPNLIPLPRQAVTRIRDIVNALDYTAMYGAFGRYIPEGAPQAMDRSVQRYLAALG